MRDALVHAEQHTSLQLHSDAQSVPLLRSELDHAQTQLRTEVAVLEASRRGRERDVSEFGAALKQMGLNLQQKFEEHERELMLEVSAQREALRLLQLRLALESRFRLRVEHTAEG